jgi:hypothetical protein
MPYANYFLNTTLNSELKGTQAITLKPCSLSAFDNDPFANNITEAIQKIKQAKSLLWLGKIVGASWIFPAETEKAEQALLESKILLQDAMERFDQTNSARCFEKADEATQSAWTLAIRAFALYARMLAMIMFVIALIILRKHRRNLEMKLSESSKNHIERDGLEYYLRKACVKGCN